MHECRLREIKNMFGHNKSVDDPKPVQAPTSYKEWADDFGFLDLIMNKKLSITKDYYIKPLAETQLDKNLYINDEEINEMYDNVVVEIVKALSDNYVNYLVSKYFASKDELIVFISESVYAELVASAVNANAKKISRDIRSKDRIAAAASLASRKEGVINAVAENSAKKQ